VWFGAVLGNLFGAPPPPYGAVLSFLAPAPTYAPIKVLGLGSVQCDADAVAVWRFGLGSFGPFWLAW
jgi:hypothetical protein